VGIGSFRVTPVAGTIGKLRTEARFASEFSAAVGIALAKASESLESLLISLPEGIQQRRIFGEGVCSSSRLSSGYGSAGICACLAPAGPRDPCSEARCIEPEPFGPPRSCWRGIGVVGSTNLVSKSRG
jgi:hypothetical protein